MKEESSYDCINSILEDICKEDKMFEANKSINYNFNFVKYNLLSISSVVDKNYSCDKCLKVKNKILSSSIKLRDVIKRPKNNVEYQKEYSELVKDFLKHFHTNHNDLEEVLNKDYTCRSYYGLKVMYELEIKNDMKKVEMISKKYDLEYLKIAFEWIDKRVAKDEQDYRELKEKAIQFIFNIFERKKLNTLKNNYLNFIKIIVSRMGEEREQFKKNKNEDYNLCYDLNLRIKGMDIIEEEKNRRERNKFLNILYDMVSNEDNKHLYKLTWIAMNIESLDMECEYCKQLKEEIVFSLGKLEILKCQKGQSRGYKKFIKDHCKFIKGYRKHFKNQHHKFNLRIFFKEIIIPLFYLIVFLIGIFYLLKIYIIYF